MASKKLKLESREETVEGQETERGDWDGLPQEILNMIFNHLPIRDLFSCSVMSKNWKKASRDVLKRSRECYAHIKNFRQDVRRLSDMIASTDLMQMINGLHIEIRPKINSRKASPSPSWRWRHNFSCSYAENMLRSKEPRRRLDKAKQKLQAVLCSQWKFLTLDMRYYWERVLSIDDALLLRELISSTSRSIQKLVVAQDEDCDFISSCGKEFSKLKVLQIQYGDTVEESGMEQFVLEFAPNLEEITGEMAHVEVHSPGNPFMLKCMKSILVAPDLVIPEARLMEGFRLVSGLHRLDLQRYQCRNSDEVTVLFSMVLNSLDTLEELHMYTLELYKLWKTSDGLKFPNLRRLSLATHWHMPIENEILALKWLNLPTLCPNLEHFEISGDAGHGNYEEEEEIPLEGPLRVDQSDVPVPIEYTCRGRWNKYNHEHLKFFHEIYPKMNKVAVVNWLPGENSEMNSIFSDLHSLEYLEIRVFLRSYFYYSPDVAIAAVLSGINIQEAKVLFSGPPRTNAELNPYIVPIYASLFNAKNLKEVKITCGRDLYEAINHSWVVQITENLPVRQVRKLTVKFEGTEQGYKALNYLRAVTTLLGAEVEGN